MSKPKTHPTRQSVEQAPAKDDEARLETFERGTQRQNDDTRTRPDSPDSVAPANERSNTND